MSPQSLDNNSDKNDKNDKNLNEKPTTTTPSHSQITSTSSSMTTRTTTSSARNMADRKATTAAILNTPSLEDGAPWYKKFMLSYLDGLLSLGAARPLTPIDLGGPSEQDKAKNTFDSVKEIYDSQARGKKSVKSALWRGFGPANFFLALGLYFVSAGLLFLPVLILNDLVEYFQTNQASKTVVDPWLEVAALFFVPVAVTVLQAQSNVIMSHAAVYVRTAVSLLIYDKILRVSASGRSKTSTGAIVNMMSNDTTQLQRFIQFSSFVMVAPVQVGASLFLIYKQVGVATFAGLGFLVLLAPVNVFIFMFVGKYRRATLKESDARVRLVNEILAGVRIIKFYAWERPFREQVEELRERELHNLTMLAYISAVGFSMIMLSAPIILPIIVFAVYIGVSDEPLTASKAFTTVALFNIMRFPFAFMPMGFLQYIQAKISLGRLDFLMGLEELEDYVEIGSDAAEVAAADEGVEVEIVDGTFKWVKDPDAAAADAGEDADDEDKSKGGAVVKPDGGVDGDDVEVDVPLVGDASPRNVLEGVALKLERGKLYGVVG
eukprot:CAMPEP_0182470714 /NCGR_PEP_ID=MMETSP1319-20130603/19127_1 /TAXON_ID=172717 /ORGANISM="Bolidomonas pacifica, Strain RCC208" /LENGTH=548 /DNA_ID=CAMNT_0024671191 /DNA_START=202 /DNA_END=1844 /DNA_ORIENTATION=+